MQFFLLRTLPEELVSLLVKTGWEEVGTFPPIT